jgi:hypothetical protein
MEWNNPRIRPQHQLLHNLIWTERTLRVNLGIQRNELSDLLVAPASGEIRMPQWEILQLPDLPDTVLFDVLILVDATLPPLDEATGVSILDAFVGSGAHECTEASLSMVSIGGDIDDVLHLGVVEQKAVDRTVASIYEVAGESSDIKSLHSLFVPVSASNELNKGFRIVRIKIDDLDSNQQDEVYGAFENLTSW